MNEKKKLALMRKKNDELNQKLDSLVEKLEAANAGREHYDECNKELVQIKSEFEKAIDATLKKQMEYDRLIAQAKTLKNEIYNSGFKVKIPFFTRIRLFIIKHRK